MTAQPAHELLRVVDCQHVSLSAFQIISPWSVVPITHHVSRITCPISAFQLFSFYSQPSTLNHQPLPLSHPKRLGRSRRCCRCVNSEDTCTIIGAPFLIP